MPAHQVFASHLLIICFCANSSTAAWAARRCWVSVYALHLYNYTL